MRSLPAAIAAVSAALLLAGCAGLDTTGPAAEASSTPKTSPETESVGVQTTCRSYYLGGTQSIDERVDRWASAVAHPSIAGNVVELTTIHDRLGGLIRDAEPGPAAILRSVRKPFATSLDGRSADPADVKAAVEVVERMCEDAGYRP